MSELLTLVAGPPAAVRLDHVVVVVPDLERAAARLVAAGLPVRMGGRHDGHGTRNLLVPLLQGYLELITVEDREAARTSRIGADVLDRLETRGGGLLGYAIEPTEAGRPLGDAIADGEPLVVSRTDEHGTATGWRMRFARGQRIAGPLPFLIDWDAGPPIPATAPATAGVRGFVGVRLALDASAAAWYRDELGPALGAVVLTAPDPAPDPTAPPLRAVLLETDDPQRTAQHAERAGIEIDGEDLILPVEEFGPQVRLCLRSAPTAPATASSSTPSTDTTS